MHHTISFLPMKAGYIYKMFILYYKKCIDHWHQGLQFTILHPTWALPGYIMFQGAFCLGLQKQAFSWDPTLHWHTDDISWQSMSFLSQPFTHSHPPRRKCVGSSPYALPTTGDDIQRAADVQLPCCGFFPCNNPFLVSAIWPETELMHTENFISVLLLLHGSSVPKPNVHWHETDGWENLFGIVIFATNTGFLISLLVYSWDSWVAWISSL